MRVGEGGALSGVRRRVEAGPGPGRSDEHQLAARRAEASVVWLPYARGRGKEDHGVRAGSRSEQRAARHERRQGESRASVFEAEEIDDGLVSNT